MRHVEMLGRLPCLKWPTRVTLFLHLPSQEDCKPNNMSLCSVVYSSSWLMTSSLIRSPSHSSFPSCSVTSQPEYQEDCSRPSHSKVLWAIILHDFKVRSINFCLLEDGVSFIFLCLLQQLVVGEPSNIYHKNKRNSREVTFSRGCPCRASRPWLLRAQS